MSSILHDIVKLAHRQPHLRQALLPLIRKTAAPWKKLPKGWTEESVKKFWGGMTGDVKHKVTKCMKRMDGKISNPGAFCASLRDRVEGKEWRSERTATTAKQANIRIVRVHTTQAQQNSWLVCNITPEMRLVFSSGWQHLVSQIHPDPEAVDKIKHFASVIMSRLHARVSHSPIEDLPIGTMQFGVWSNPEYGTAGYILTAPAESGHAPHLITSYWVANFPPVPAARGWWARGPHEWVLEDFAPSRTR